MGTAVSFQYFPVDFNKLGLFQSNDKAIPSTRPVLKSRDEHQGRRSIEAPPQPKSHPISTAPQYLAVAQLPPAASAEVDRAEVLPDRLTAGDGKAEVKSLDRSLDAPADHRQRSATASSKAVSASRKAWPGLQDSKQPAFPGVQHPKKIRQLDREIRQALEAQNTQSLRKLLDAHPHAGPDPADNSVGAFFLRCFREVASWFNSAAFAWQGKQAVALLEKAASIGNVDAIQMLLDRGMDLGKDKRMVEPALRIAVTGGNAEATRLLLREVLRKDPGYVKNVELTSKAARARYEDVLEVLVEEGMALPRENSWPHYGQLIEGYLRWFAAGKTTTWAGFAAESVNRLVRKLDSNAGSYIPRRAASAPATLAQRVVDEFEGIMSTGCIRPELRKRLMDLGMYCLLADMVVDATGLAAASPSWNAPGANRKVLFAKALDQSAGDRIDIVHQAGDASGDPDLFDEMLSPQVDLLIAYQQSCRAQDAVRATRKRRATL